MTSTWWWLLLSMQNCKHLRKEWYVLEYEKPISRLTISQLRSGLLFSLFYYIFLIRKIKISGWWLIDQSIPNFRISLKCYIISFGKTVWRDTSMEAKPAITCTKVQISALLLNSLVCCSLILNCTVNTTYA